MILVYLDIGVAYKKSAGFHNGVFFWRSREILTQDIQKWRCQRSMVVRAVELWLTMRTLDWQRGGPNTLNSTKLLFSMDSASPWAAKIVGNEFCHGPGKLMMGNYAVMLGNYAVIFGNYDGNFWWCFHSIFFWKNNKNQTHAGSKTSQEFKCTSLPLSRNVVHT